MSQHSDLAFCALQDAVRVLQLGPYFIPKDTLIQINLWGMQHDERWWEDAQEFKPERWMNDKTGGDRSGGLAYMPFGLGPHNCVGLKLACKRSDLWVDMLQHNAIARS